MEKERKSNIELLRVIAMVLIISFHIVYKSGFTFENLTASTFIVKSFYMFGELGVNIFILITGYFMINGKFSVKKLIYLILEVDFYYLITIFIEQQLGITKLSTLKDYFLMFFPTILNKYWFITAYLIIYILSPYLNIFIKNMTKEEHKKVIIIALLIWSIIPTVFGIFYNNTETMLYYNRFIWMIVMYLVGAYIRLYSIKLFIKKKNATICAIISYIAMLASIVVIYKFKDVFAKIGTKEIAYFWRPNTILMFLLSVSIFEVFLNIRMKNIKIINKIASTTLGIYMIHDGPLNKYIWNGIFSIKENLNSNSVIFVLMYIIGVVIIIFFFGMIIDLIRQFIERNTVKKILDSKKFDNISKRISKLGNNLLELI